MLLHRSILTQFSYFLECFLLHKVVQNIITFDFNSHRFLLRQALMDISRYIMSQEKCKWKKISRMLDIEFVSNTDNRGMVWKILLSILKWEIKRPNHIIFDRVTSNFPREVSWSFWPWDQIFNFRPWYKGGLVTCVRTIAWPTKNVFSE